MPEKCENCGAGIGNLETPQIHDGHVVCVPCKGRLATPVAEVVDAEASQRDIAYQRMQKNVSHLAAVPEPQTSAATRTIVGWVAAVAFVCVVVSFFLVRDQYDTGRAALVPIARWGGGVVMIVAGIAYGLISSRR